MITQVQNFIRPTSAAYYMSPQTVQAVAQALDENRDGRIGRDEVNLSPQLARQIDRNRDGMVQLFELSEALENDQVSVRDLSQRSAQNVANTLIRNQVFAQAFGQLGMVIDTDRDSFVSRQELTRALSSGQVAISGNYLVTTGSSGTHPGQGPGHGHGISLNEARRFIQEIESSKMKKDNWGNYDPSTGIFKPEEANRRIQEYLRKEVLDSGRLSLGDKFALLSENLMKKDNWGNYDPSTGALKATEAEEIAKTAMSSLRLSDHVRAGEAREALQAIAAQRMKADNWGNDDPNTGLLKPATANDAIKRLLENEVLNSRSIRRDEKLQILKDHAMRKDNWGNYDRRSGALTAEEVNRLSQKVFDQREDQDNFGNDPFKPGHPGSNPFGNDPFKPGQPGSNPFGNDPFKK